MAGLGPYCVSHFITGKEGNSERQRTGRSLTLILVRFPYAFLYHSATQGDKYKVCLVLSTHTA